MPLAEPRRFKFDPSHIESVDQMLLGAKIAQNSLAPVAEEDMDDAEQQPVYSEKVDKILERYDLILIRVLYNQGNPPPKRRNFGHVIYFYLGVHRVPARMK